MKKLNLIEEPSWDELMRPSREIGDAYTACAQPINIGLVKEVREIFMRYDKIIRQVNEIITKHNESATG